MEGVVERTTVKLGPHYIHEGERRGQSSETAIEASTRTNFFFTNDRAFLIGSKRTVCCFDDVASRRRADDALLLKSETDTGCWNDIVAAGTN